MNAKYGDFRKLNDVRLLMADQDPNVNDEERREIREIMSERGLSYRETSGKNLPATDEVVYSQLAKNGNNHKNAAVIDAYQ